MNCKACSPFFVVIVVTHFFSKYVRKHILVYETPSYFDKPQVLQGVPKDKHKSVTKTQNLPNLAGLK